MSEQEGGQFRICTHPNGPVLSKLHQKELFSAERLLPNLRKRSTAANDSAANAKSILGGPTARESCDESFKKGTRNTIGKSMTRSSIARTDFTCRESILQSVVRPKDLLLLMQQEDTIAHAELVYSQAGL